MEQTEIALRAFVDSKSPNNKFSYETDYTDSNDIVFVIDTETTEDQYQNLKFGSCGIWISGHLHQVIIFHSDIISKKEFSISKKYVSNHKRK